MSTLASEQNNQDFGERLARIRLKKKLSQAAFAETLGLSPRAYANYERGEREAPLAVLRALHEVHGVDPAWMIGVGRGVATAGAATRDPVVDRAPESRRRRISRHERIKMRLHLIGSSFADIARELEVAPTTVTAVSQGRARSQRIEAMIAAKLSETPERLWPRRVSSSPIGKPTRSRPRS